MEQNPLVSIITITYNHEKYIKFCINSVLLQTYSNWELIIIDDGSTDGTREIISQYEDRRIKYIEQKNTGIWRLKESYNKALKIAQGKFIAILEGDDFWPRWKLETQISAFEKEGVVLSWGKVAMTNSEGMVTGYYPKKKSPLQKYSRSVMTRKLLCNNFIPACTVVCRKDALCTINGFQQINRSPCTDHATWVELSLIGELVPIDEVLGCWRQHENQSSVKWVKELIEGHNKLIVTFYKKMLIRGIEKSCDINELNKTYQQNMVKINYALGLARLKREQYIEGRRLMKLTLRRGRLSIKFWALLWILCSYINLNPNRVAALIKKR